MLLLALPLALVLFRWSVAVYLAMTVLVWALIWVPVFLVGAGAVTLPVERLASPYFIHPMAAQLFFFTGVAIGIRKAQIEAWISTPGNLVVPGALLFLIATNYMAQVSWIIHHFDQKQFGGPLRLAELLAVMILLCRLVGPDSFKSPSVGPVEACGRHTLTVFAITTVGAFVFSYLTDWRQADRLVYGLCIAANVGLCIACGYLLEKRRAHTRHDVVELASLTPRTT
jgi:hypothetical protein